MGSLQQIQIARAAAVIPILAVSMALLLNFFKPSTGQRSIYKLIYTVPPSHLASTKQAIFNAGGGTYEMGKYKNTTFESPGLGVFTPDKDANPNIGSVGTEEKVEEIRVEVRCEGLGVTQAAVKALLLAHPYETVGYEVFKAVDSFMSFSKSELLAQRGT